MQHRCVESYVPIRVAKKGVQLAQSWVVPLIAPSKAPILKVDFLELTRLQGCSEPVDPTSIHTSLVFVTCMTDLVEVSNGQSSNTRHRLVGDKLGEEGILASRVRGTVDGC